MRKGCLSLTERLFPASSVVLPRLQTENNATQRPRFSSSFGMMVTRSDKLRAGDDPSCGTSVLLPVHRCPDWAQCESSCFLLALSWGKSGDVSFGEGCAHSPGLLGLLCPPGISLGGYKVGIWWVWGSKSFVRLAVCRFEGFFLLLVLSQARIPLGA